ncbi:MAG: cation transporter, partial [Proteobacteria bacterium]|nr:cation transporter [Pseudomonadota bacterium]
MSSHSNCGRLNPVNDTPLGKKHARVLGTVTLINAVMVFVEGAASLKAHSTSLFTDTLDMLGDAVGAALGRYGLKRSERWQAGASLIKAATMMALGLGALGWAAFRILNPLLPVAGLMGIVGGMALAANAACTALLYPYRNDNLNLKSTFTCVRNDMISNVGVMLAGAASKMFLSFWPDVAVAAVVSSLFIRSSIKIAKESLAVMKKQPRVKADNPDTSAPSRKGPKFAQGIKNTLKTLFNKKAAATTDAPTPA